MIKLVNIQKNYGPRTVLSGIHFSLEKGQKIALVGGNGVGKTTLLKILAGLEEPDSGTIEMTGGPLVGYMPQDTSVTSKETISDYLHKVSGLTAIEEEIRNLLPQFEDLAKRGAYGDAYEKFERLGGDSFEYRMEIILTGFGFQKKDIDRNLQSFSSGQKSKIVLTGILLTGADLLLLDEPTNNLDIPALIWLETFLQRAEAACIIVSHDRRFLDRVAGKVFELNAYSGTLTITNGRYSDYLEMEIKRRKKAKLAYRVQQEEVERLTQEASKKKSEAIKGSHWQGTDNDKFVRGFKRDLSSKSARVAKVLEKRIEQTKKIEAPMEKDPFEISLIAEKNPGRMDLKVTDVIAGYINGFKIGPVSLAIQYGDRVAIMGLNGSGKSTLLRTITGQLLPMSGKVEMGAGIRIGNLMQEHENLSRSKSLFEFFRDKTGFSEEESYSKLTKFGFHEFQIKQLINTLSPGERARLLLSVFSALSVNLLVLDEPTNHLDLEALEALEAMLESYQGTLLLVSHDRYFLEQAAMIDSYVLEAGKLARIDHYGQYVSSAEEKARKLINQL